jgi:hypothetical protein
MKIFCSSGIPSYFSIYMLTIQKGDTLFIPTTTYFRSRSRAVQQERLLFYINHSGEILWQEE